MGRHGREPMTRRGRHELRITGAIRLRNTGLSNPEIAVIMGCERRTVELLFQSARRKELEVRRCAE
jgi:DNA-binding CsgD family transcriptional regulator